MSSEVKKSLADHPVFGLAFRPFFLGAATFGVSAIFLWIGLLHSTLLADLPGGTLWWHLHEMVFGFAIAVALGFLLTAVQNWTGVPSVRKTPLMVLFLLWVIARILLIVPATSASWMAIITDLIFIPLGTVFFARCVLAVKQWRNFIFVPFLTLFTLANAAMHWAKLTNDPALALAGAKAGVFLMVLFMTVIGGRVIPFFTANATGVQRRADLPWLDRTALVGGLLIIPGVFAESISVIQLLTGILCLLLAVVHTARWSRWHFMATLRQPILWSLHVSYLMIPVGFFLYGLSRFGLIQESGAIHALTVGGIGLMVLAMMSRVALGHTGRPLILSRWMPTAYLALLLAAICRSLGPVLSLPPFVVYDVSGLLWCWGFGVFLVLYWPILTRPRADGRPG